MAFLAAPAQVVDAGVDHAAAGAEQLRAQIADAAERIVVVHPHLVGELLGVERPALGVAGEAERLADQRQAGVGQREAALELMAGQALVIDRGGEIPASASRRCRAG